MKMIFLRDSQGQYIPLMLDYKDISDSSKKQSVIKRNMSLNYFLDTNSLGPKLVKILDSFNVFVVATVSNVEEKVCQGGEFGVSTGERFTSI